MDTLLVVNMLLNFKQSTEDESIYRILWIDPQGLFLILINIHKSSALPIFQDTSTILEGIQDGNISIETEDPFRVSLPDSEIPIRYKEKRDEAWNLIEPLVGNKNPDIFDPKKRGALINILNLITVRRKSLIYQYLRRYWQGGQIKNALLPHWNQCGAPGVTRQDNGIKRGRPNLLGQIDPTKVGYNADEIMRGKIIIGATTYRETQKKPLMDAYRFTLKKFFMNKEIGEDGSLHHELMERYPTYIQFKYWYYKYRDKGYEKALSNIEGDRKFLLNYRPLSGRSTDISFGPGSVFQIDATIGDIYLVSIFDRTRIIGKPIVYLVVDVFSYKIVGIYVGIEEMSKISAMMALDNTLSDKVEFCSKYGINISSDDWNCHHKPEILLADRGELIGYYGDDLVNNANIDVTNTASYRADMKGLVEHCFNLLNIRAIHDIPGSYDKPRGRGERDPRLDATLNIYEFTQILINTVLCLNHRYLHNYPVCSEMITQHVNLKPNELWNWGMIHRNGYLSTVDPMQRKALLYPRDTAAVDGMGLSYKGYHYSDLSIRNWQIKARKEGRSKLEIAYHPRITDEIYLVSKDGKSLKPLCRVENSSDELFKMASFEDIDDYNFKRRGIKAEETVNDLEQWADFKHKNEAIVQKASKQKKLAEKQGIPKSKQEKLGSIRENREYEKEALRTLEHGTPTHLKQQVEIPIDDLTYIAPEYDLSKW